METKMKTKKLINFLNRKYGIDEEKLQDIVSKMKNIKWNEIGSFNADEIILGMKTLSVHSEDNYKNFKNVIENLIYNSKYFTSMHK